jgi:hypothetical protein
MAGVSVVALTGVLVWVGGVVAAAGSVVSGVGVEVISGCRETGAGAVDGVQPGIFS